MIGFVVNRGISNAALGRDADAVTAVNNLADLQRWRAVSTFVGWQWAPTPYGNTCAEIRLEADDRKRARVVGRVLRYVGDCCDVECAFCGRTVDALDTPLAVDGMLELAGPAICSDRCRDAIEEAAGVRCDDCGEGPALGCNCATADTLPCPPPTTIPGPVETEPLDGPRSTSAA